MSSRRMCSIRVRALSRGQRHSMRSTSASIRIATPRECCRSLSSRSYSSLKKKRVPKLLKSLHLLGKVAARRRRTLKWLTSPLLLGRSRTINQCPTGSMKNPSEWQVLRIGPQPRQTHSRQTTRSLRRPQVQTWIISSHHRSNLREKESAPSRKAC